MLTIRQEQMNVFSKYMVEKYVNLVVAYLRKNYPERTRNLEDADLRRLVTEGMDKAARYGIRIEADVTRFVELMLKFGDDFDLDPQIWWAGDILNDDKIAAREKIKRLYEHITDNPEAADV